MLLSQLGGIIIITIHCYSNGLYFMMTIVIVRWLSVFDDDDDGNCGMIICECCLWINIYCILLFYFTAGLDQKRAHLSVGTSSEVSLKVTDADISTLTATIRSPAGMEEPCLLKRLANGHLGTCLPTVSLSLCVCVCVCVCVCTSMWQELKVYDYK